MIRDASRGGVGAKCHFIENLSGSDVGDLATRIFLEGLTSNSRPTWLPSACGLLLVSRYKNFDDQMLVDAVNTDFENMRELSEKLLYSFAAARGEDTNRDIGDRGAGGQQSRSALLAQAGESLYGVGHELAGPFPK